MTILNHSVLISVIQSTLLEARVKYLVKCLEPFTSKPSVQEIQGRNWLIHRDHVASTEDVEECEVTTRLDLAILVAIIKLDIIVACLVEVLLSWPLESLSPGLVA